MAGYLAEQLQRGLDDLFVPRFTSRRIASPKPGGTNIAWNLWKTHPTFQQQPLPVNLTSVPEELLDIGHAGRALPKIPSKIAKFRLQIVENRLEFQSQSYLAFDLGRDELEELEGRIELELLTNMTILIQFYLIRFNSIF